MLPITGPQVRQFDSNVVSGYVLNRKYSLSYRQVRPYNLPLGYTNLSRVTTIVSAWPHLQSIQSAGGISDFQSFEVANPTRYSDWGGAILSSLITDVSNRAIAKLQGKFSNPASTLTALVESSQTIAMIERRLRPMTTFVKLWGKKRYKSAILSVLNGQKFSNPFKERKRRARIRNLAKQPRKDPLSKSLASGWIETWFGWLPTIGDLQVGYEALSRDLPSSYYSAKSSIVHHIDRFIPVENIVSLHQGETWCRCGASIEISNPNLYLASQLGLTNPIYTAFEVIPYSWLFSWFNNVEQFFRQFSVYHGVQVSNPWKTVGMRDSLKFLYGAAPVSDKTGADVSQSFKRSLGLPEVTLVFRGINRLSVTRGLTLSSLLLLRLKNDSAVFRDLGRV